MSTDIEKNTIRRVYWRIIPLFFLATLFNYLDRINIGFASLHMNEALGFSSAVFGFGASAFFVGYMLLEVPSNLMLHKLGARLWIARILISWGIIACAFAFVWNDTSFYVLRFLLGVAEAGFLPGLAFYLTLWFPKAYRARAVAGYIIASQVAAVVGGPLSGWLLTSFDDTLGLQGWQWMFLLEGLPTVLLGIVFLCYLTERPEQASWLTQEQRQWLETTLARERADLEQGRKFRVADIITDIRVWSLAALFGCALVGIYGLLIWMPQIIKSMGNLTDIQIGFLSAVPPLLGVVSSIIVGYTSDRTGDRKYHLALVYLIGCIGLIASALSTDKTVAYLFICMAGLGLYAGNALFWSLNSSLMTGAASAAAIAFVNTVAQFGGLIGPWMIGFVKDSTGSFTLALQTLAAFLLIASIIAAFLRVKPKKAMEA